MHPQVRTGRSSKSKAGTETQRMVQGMQGLVQQMLEMYCGVGCVCVCGWWGGGERGATNCVCGIVS